MMSEEQIREAVDKVIERAETAPPILITNAIKPASIVKINVGLYDIVFQWTEDDELHILTIGATPPLSIILPKNTIDALREFIKE